MAGLYDIYLLANERSERAVFDFLNYFAPQRKEFADEYRFPEYSDTPNLILKTSKEAISHCCLHLTEAQSIYWQRLGSGDPTHLMIYFTRDQQLILGLSASEAGSSLFFKKLKQHGKSRTGYITFESPPALTESEFRYLVD